MILVKMMLQLLECLDEISWRSSCLPEKKRIHVFLLFQVQEMKVQRGEVIWEITGQGNGVDRNRNVLIH